MERLAMHTMCIEHEAMPGSDVPVEAKDSAGIDKNSSVSNVMDSIDKTYGAGAIMKLGGGRVFADGIEVHAHARPPCHSLAPSFLFVFRSRTVIHISCTRTHTLSGSLGALVFLGSGSLYLSVCVCISISMSLSLSLSLSIYLHFALFP